MGYFGKIEEKNLAITLRSEGLSYKEILQHVSVSKDTLSRWCKDIPLTETQKLRLLTNKQMGQRKGSLIAADRKRTHRIERTKHIYSESKKEIGMLNERDKFLIGIALYAAEGNKMDGKGGFANADPKLIKFMMQWLLQFVKLPLSRIRGAIWIHDDLDEKAAKDFWAKLTGLNKNQFHKTYLVKAKPGSRKIRKNIHQYGVFSIRFSDTLTHRKIMGWIYAIIDDKITDTIPR